MGCIHPKLNEKSASSSDSGPGLRKPNIRRSIGKAQQGVYELKRNYVIDAKTDVIGTGAFGKVYKTHRKHNRRSMVAIKVLDKRQIKTDIKTIIDEIAILSKLDHPNIVKYFETYDDRNFLFLVMEYINGEELLGMVKNRYEGQGMPEAVAANYLRQILLAVNYCHGQGIVHRDIKPTNIMVTKNGTIRLIDFGLATVNTATLRTRTGTPSYMAPEVLEGHYGPQCDMWSIGVMLYQLISGCLPFEARSQAKLFKMIRENEWDFQHRAFR